MREETRGTHYDSLGVSMTASKDQIKLAYRRKAKELHPDKSQNRETEFRQIQKAWECLREQDRRKAYDDNLLHQTMIRESKVHAAMPIKLSDMEEGEDEGGHGCYVYDCRCGDQIEVWKDSFNVPQESILVECPSCSFGYAVDTTQC
jgi:curved DNA-binding protein CbpA